MFKGNVIFEEVAPDVMMVFRVKDIILNTKTRYQDVQIVDLYQFGRSLILDGYIQSTEMDEYIYHETLVHPALASHPGPKKILIVGGSEGATLREVLKYSGVEKVVMIDIDGELLEYTRKYLEVMHRGSFESGKLELIVEDGYKYVSETEDSQYDIVILDLTDPYSSDIAKKLYSGEFYSNIKRILKPEGMMVTQAGNSYFYPDSYLEVRDNAASVFNNIWEYWTWIPSFGYNCNFIMASDRHNPASLDSRLINRILSERRVETRLYCGEYHVGLFKQGIIIGGNG